MRIWLLLVVLGAMAFTITGCPQKSNGGSDRNRNEEDMTDEEDESAVPPIVQVAMIDWLG